MLINRKNCARLCAIVFLVLFCSTAFGGPKKVDVCHIPPDAPENLHTISISKNAVRAHIRHGDILGECDDIVEPPPPPPPPPTPTNLCTCFTTDTEAEPEKLDPAELGEVSDCMADLNSEGIFAVFYANGAIACSGYECAGDIEASPDCGAYGSEGGLIVQSPGTISPEDDQACRVILASSCITP